MVIIRKPEDKDAEALAKLDKIWQKENISLGMNICTKKDFIRKIKKEICFVADMNGKIVGYACGKKQVYNKKKKLFFVKKGEKFVNFDSLYVLKPYRNRVIGRKLVSALIKRAKKEKFDSILLVADNKNQEKLVSFYKHCNFKIVFTRLKMSL